MYIHSIYFVYMNTEVINLRVEPNLKRKAQRLAQELGITLSGLMSGLLTHAIRTKTVTFSAAKEIPSDYLIEMIKESEEDIKAGRVSPAFDNANDAIKWLKKPKKKYARSV